MKSFTKSAIAKFVAKFLFDNGPEELVDEWNSPLSTGIVPPLASECLGVPQVLRTSPSGASRLTFSSAPRKGRKPRLTLS